MFFWLRSFKLCINVKLIHTDWCARLVISAEYLNDHIVTVSRYLSKLREVYQPGEHICYTFKSTFGLKQTTSCVDPKPVGSYVTVSISRLVPRLQLCEVEVFGYLVQGKARTHARTYTHTHARTYTHTHTQTCTHAHTHTHTHAHTHKRRHARKYYSFSRTSLKLKKELCYVRSVFLFKRLE